MANSIEYIAGSGIPIRGNEIDTDQIIPAEWLKEITFKNMGKHLFDGQAHNEDGSLNDHPVNNENYSNAKIMIVENNFGCGSSRQHAPESIQRWGIDALVGASFAEIFAGNCLAMGIPTVSVSADQARSLLAHTEQNSRTEYALDLNAMTLSYDDQTLPVTMPDASRKALLAGTYNPLDLLKANMDKVIKIAASLPYMRKDAA